MRKVLMAISALAMLFACNGESDINNNQGGGKHDNIDAPSVTIGADHISSVSALLMGKANLGSSVASDLKVGFYYSKSAGILPSNSTIIEAAESDSDYNYTASITGLEPATTYYFRSFVRQNGQDTYGETKEFKTKDISSMLHTQEATAISAVCAKLNAVLDMTDIQCTSKGFGFYWGTSEESLPNKITADVGDGKISADLLSLTPATQYYYQAYAVLDGKEFIVNILSFNTKDMFSLLHTEEASSISATSAKLNACFDLTDIQCTSNDFGFYWGMSAESLPNKITADVGDGMITADMLSLTPATRYFYQAYIVLDGKELRGNAVSFDTKPISTLLNTQEATGITAISAKLNACFDLTDIQCTSKDFGFYWGMSAESLPNIITADVGDGMITADLLSLTPATRYFYQAYIVLDGKELRGDTVSFDTKELSSLLHNQDATCISAISATLNASFDLTDVKYTNRSFGFYWGTRAESLPNNVSAEERDGSISADLLSLTPSTQYYYQAYIVLDGRMLLRENILTFTTKELTSLIQTKDAVEIKATSAVLSAKLDLTDVKYNGNIYYGFYWGDSENSINKRIYGGDLKNNEYTSIISSLSHKSQYWYKAYVLIGGQFFGDVKTFMTDVVSVESVSLDINEYTFRSIGGVRTLRATVLPADATDKSVEWSSSNEDVATVDKNGTVTAMGNGKATITVMTKDQGKKATCSISVTQMVTAISLNHGSLELNEGASASLTVTKIRPDNAYDKTFFWTSSDTNIATVDNNGRVTAVSKGEATIQAVANDGYGGNGACLVRVKRPVVSIDLNTSSITLFNGETEALTATVYPLDASDTSVKWESSDESVATVTSEGVITGCGRGKTIISVKAKDGSGTYASCDVEVKQQVTEISLQRLMDIFEGRTKMLSIGAIMPVNANDQTVTWTTSDNSIAMVDNDGRVTGVSPGKAIIKVSANDGYGANASCTVRVSRPVDTIDLNKTSTVLYVGQTEILTATVIPSDANNTHVSWKSSNESVATVSSSGVITGKARGNASITVTANDGSGAFATCDVEVKQYVTKLTLNKKSLSLSVGEEEVLSYTILPENANDKSCTWSSSDNSIATVDNTGKVTAKANGRAIISLSANDGSGVYASCSIYICPIGAVDLGFETSDGKILYWATCNLCDTGFVGSPEELGGFYAWGETATKKAYGWSTYKWSNNGVEKTLTKYNNNSAYGPVDNKTVLETGPEGDDAASKILGGSWRIPTDEEWTELRTKCTWTWKKESKGYLITAPNGNSIFLPKTGECTPYSTSYHGTYGYYWSSSLYLDADYEDSQNLAAFGVCINDQSFNRTFRSRGLGESIRPVSE